MKKKLLSILMTTAVVLSMLAGCGSSNSTPAANDNANKTADAGTTTDTPADTTADTTADAPADTTAKAGGKIGVAMPTKDLQRWNQDGSNMEAQLKAAGYEVDIQYA